MALVSPEYSLEQELKLLNGEKARAVRDEKYNKAKRLKEVIAEVEQAKATLVSLECQKNEARDKEDFETAHKLKKEIDKVHQNACDVTRQLLDKKGDN